MPRKLPWHVLEQVNVDMPSVRCISIISRHCLASRLLETYAVLGYDANAVDLLLARSTDTCCRLATSDLTKSIMTWSWLSILRSDANKIELVQVVQEAKDSYTISERC